MKKQTRFSAAVSVMFGFHHRCHMLRRPVGAANRCACALLMLGVVQGGSLAFAQMPYVQFDVDSMVGCRDVTPAEFEKANPDERLMEAKFQISSLIRQGREDDLLQFLYRIESPERSVQIADYLPKTVLATNVVGNVGLETKLEKSSSLGITAAGHYDQILSGDAKATHGKKTTSSVRYELLPRLDLVAAAGTTARGTGVYFKLKPSDRTSLEGSKDFALVLRVPRSWRGDYVRVVCEARSHRRGVVRPLDSATTCGAAVFVVALYDQQDPSAKAAARRLARADQQLLSVASRQRRAIERHKYPTIGHEIGATLALVSPKIPKTWLRQVYQRPAAADSARFESHLPDPVRRAAVQYSTAKRTLHQLCGSSRPVAARGSSL